MIIEGWEVQFPEDWTAEDTVAAFELTCLDPWELADLGCTVTYIR